VIVPIHHDTLVLGDDFDERGELGVIFGCGDVRVMQLQEFPGGVGVGEGGVEEDGSVLICVRQNAKMGVGRGK
jgi:hypothetical protein